MINRRRFIQMSAGAAALLAARRRAYAFYQSSALKKFIQPMRGAGPGGIPVALPDGTAAPVTGAVHYSMNIGQYQDTLHPALGPTTLWGYSPSAALGEGGYPRRHLGGIVVAQRGVPIQLTFTNNLPPTHILPVDITSLAMAVGGFPDAVAKFGGNGYNAACVHLHGGLVSWISDGGPMAWFTPAASGGTYGPSIANATTNLYKLLNPGLQPGQAEYYYPNNQSARLLWYHDHAHDITRLNAYAGVASAYIIRDAFEGNLRNQGLPDFVENGGREIPLVIQDKIFVGANIAAVDPTWKGPSGVGSLWYPHIYEKNRWKSSGGGNTPQPPDPSCIPEMFGDTMLANGTVFPEATVEARRYRLRVLNACQARFLNLQLYVDDGSIDGITLNAATLAPTNAKGPDFLVIGTEGGFLSKPVNVASNAPFNPVTMKGSLVTGPAERWDIIVDFSGFAGKKVILYNDAPAPFPMGDPRNDYFPGAPKNPTITTPGFGPNTRQIMRFNVVAATSADPPLTITTTSDLTPGIDPSLVGMWTAAPLPPPAGVPVRILTLNEDYDSWGRLIQRVGTNVQPAKVSGNTFGRNYMDPSTENPKAGATEVWQIVNLTADAHPMHFHLVNVQVLQRQPFNSFGPPSGAAMPNYNGPATGPEAAELGWKETVKMYPGTVTTVIMRFDLPTDPPGVTVPNSLSPSLGVAGKEYVWHCHILEHEEHDMMRPLVIT